MDQVSYSGFVANQSIGYRDSITFASGVFASLRIFLACSCSTNEIPAGTRNYRGDKIFQG